MRVLKLAAMLSLLGLLAVPAVEATPITYNYTMDVTATNIAGLADGSLSFTLSDAPTASQILHQTDISNEVTAFNAQIDGFFFTAFNSCGSHPTGCVSNLEFTTGPALWNLTYTGQSTAIAGVTLTTNNTVFSHFYIQSNGQYADGNLVFTGTSTPRTTAVPEPASVGMMLGGLALLGGITLFGRRRMSLTRA